ncbi:hypothetical protein POPTR_018G136502v4 [Populus trichocarpa]|uniref:Uncharacterized protein n=1 Tax=Populus trichocarpa TaxID=3694 RepID=A0ACC0RNN2_POPTR|nr:hypothetical protein POPTR_018G136502v4 [Populus trichocarpa]
MEKNLLVDVQKVKLQLKGKEKNLTIESSIARGCFSLGPARKWQIAKPVLGPILKTVRGAKCPEIYPS